MFFKKSTNWCAIIILISFFLPWWHFFFSVSGYEVIGFLSNLGRLGSALNKDYEPSIPFLFYLIYIFPVFSIVILFLSFRKINSRVFCIFSGVVFILWFIWYFAQLDEKIWEVGIFKVLGIGIYATILASLGLIFGTFIERKTTNQSSKNLMKQFLKMLTFFYK